MMYDANHDISDINNCVDAYNAIDVLFFILVIALARTSPSSVENHFYLCVWIKNKQADNRTLLFNTTSRCITRRQSIFFFKTIQEALQFIVRLEFIHRISSRTNVN